MNEASQAQMRITPAQYPGLDTVGASTLAGVEVQADLSAVTLTFEAAGGRTFTVIIPLRAWDAMNRFVINQTEAIVPMVGR